MRRPGLLLAIALLAVEAPPAAAAKGSGRPTAIEPARDVRAAPRGAVRRWIAKLKPTVGAEPTSMRSPVEVSAPLERDTASWRTKTRLRMQAKLRSSRAESRLKRLATRSLVEEEKLTLGDRAADTVASFAGSWRFITASSLGMTAWMAFNGLSGHPFDAPPYIGLNLLLSTVAALQGPFILMSQGRQAAKDRRRAEEDLAIDVKAEEEVRELHAKIDALTDSILTLADQRPGVGAVARARVQAIRAAKGVGDGALAPATIVAKPVRASFGARAADRVTAFAGSWKFIGTAAAGMAGWMAYNGLSSQAFDPAPFIGLNLVLSAMAGLQAPFIMMSQNRQAERDRGNVEQDLAVDIHAEQEVRALHTKIDALTDVLSLLLAEPAAPTAQATPPSR